MVCTACRSLGEGMRLKVNAERCCGAGMCVLVDPALFDQRDDDGTVVLLDEHPSAEHHGAAREAARSCPSRAIVIIDDLEPSSR